MSVTIPAGRINRLFGTDGGVMLSLYADFPEEFDTGTPLLVTIDALEVPLYCERFERRGTSGAVASFADFDTERRAQELVGLEFRIECDEDEDDEFYLEDLIGFAEPPPLRGEALDLRTLEAPLVKGNWRGAPEGLTRRSGWLPL